MAVTFGMSVPPDDIPVALTRVEIEALLTNAKDACKHCTRRELFGCASCGLSSAEEKLEYAETVLRRGL